MSLKFSNSYFNDFCEFILVCVFCVAVFSPTKATQVPNAENQFDPVTYISMIKDIVIYITVALDIMDLIAKMIGRELSIVGKING